jgi:putative Mg2+ transporter-C (MgtC) family protein
VGAAATLAILAVFRYVERALPSEFYAQLSLKFDRQSVLGEEQMRELVTKYGFSIANLSWRLSEGGRLFEYKMVIRTRKRQNAETLSRVLRERPEVLEFRIAPTGD